ncbi:MAG: hypothetical protein CFE29_03745 [Bradyrhizobiaceae bacterium PARB1]|jgi:DNA-binding transcriptional regulator YdaS (Cro superfamily)|nr:MAG: hypothetical protein CFE29_03745 [Bradyrhizobiaceae bacterium PARB1]
MSRRVDRVIAAGKLRFGHKWQSPFARLVKISQPHLANIVAGVRELTPDNEIKIAEALRAEAKRLRATADKIERIASTMPAKDNNDD